MRATIEDFCKALLDEEFFNEEAEEWQFRDGSACAICTVSAEQVAQRCSGMVLGYRSTSNTTASIGCLLLMAMTSRSSTTAGWWTMGMARGATDHNTDLRSEQRS